MRFLLCGFFGLLGAIGAAYGADLRDSLETVSYVFTCCVEQDEEESPEKLRPEDEEEYWKKLCHYVAVLSIKLCPAEKDGKKVVRLEIREEFRAVQGRIVKDKSTGAEVTIDCTAAPDGRLLAVPGYDKGDAWDKASRVREYVTDILYLLGPGVDDKKPRDRYRVFDAECRRYATSWEEGKLEESAEQYYSPPLGRVIWASRTKTFEKDVYKRRAVLSANEQEVKAHVEQMEARQAREQGIQEDEVKPLK